MSISSLTFPQQLPRKTFPRFHWALECVVLSAHLLGQRYVSVACVCVSVCMHVSVYAKGEEGVSSPAAKQLFSRFLSKNKNLPQGKAFFQ